MMMTPVYFPIVTYELIRAGSPHGIESVEKRLTEVNVSHLLSGEMLLVLQSVCI